MTVGVLQECSNLLTEVRYHWEGYFLWQICGTCTKIGLQYTQSLFHASFVLRRFALTSLANLRFFFILRPLGFFAGPLFIYFFFFPLS